MEVEVKEFGVRIRLVVEPYDVDAMDLDRIQERTMQSDEIEIQSDDGTDVPGDELVQTVVVEETAAAAVSRPALERALRNWRREEAIRRGVPTYIIMTERTILGIVEGPPLDLVQLRELKGIGPKTMELYGDSLLRLITDTEEE